MKIVGKLWGFPVFKADMKINISKKRAARFKQALCLGCNIELGNIGIIKPVKFKDRMAFHNASGRRRVIKGFTKYVLYIK